MNLEKLIQELKEKYDKRSLKNIINLMEDHVCQIIAERLLLKEEVQDLPSKRKEVKTLT